MKHAKKIIASIFLTMKATILDTHGLSHLSMLSIHILLENFVLSFYDYEFISIDIFIFCEQKNIYPAVVVR